jgi:hypothetical protein
MNNRLSGLTSTQVEEILKKAYIPEHIIPLMVAVSKGKPLLIEDFLCFTKDNWFILVGYPLDQRFSLERSEKIIQQVLETFRPEILWFIGPEIPASLLDSSTDRETDRYYKLDIGQTRLKNSLLRVAEKASKELTIQRANTFSKEHQKLISELLKREKLRPRVRELYRAMPDYVSRSSSACVLNAWDKKGNLSAFYVVELAAKRFITYVLGTHSKKNYVPHASDLLFLEMIKLTREQGKNEINLGLGVNEGIRRFKEKWGGVPFLNYEECEYCPEGIKTISMIRTLEGKL